MRHQEVPAVQPTVQSLRDNLKDAGCNAKFAEHFLVLERSGQYREQLQLLADHRRKLLECLHKEERRIDCLDYLVYQMEKRHSRKE